MLNILYGKAVAEDVRDLKALWKAGFGDEGAYVDNFFAQWRPEQMFVAKIGAEIVAMSYYFATKLHRLGKTYDFAYVYAVATHPKYEKKGIASGLLSYLCQALEGDFSGVTTVPATDSLHRFFGRNGFLEYFQYETMDVSGEKYVPIALSQGDYEEKRQKYLEETGVSFITLAEDGSLYQESVCALGKGGYCRVGEEFFCVEQASDKACVVKECFGACVPGFGLEVVECRTVPGRGNGNLVDFGMIQWFSLPPEDWKEGEGGYLGLAFD